MNGVNLTSVVIMKYGNCNGKRWRTFFITSSPRNDTMGNVSMEGSGVLIGKDAKITLEAEADLTTE